MKRTRIVGLLTAAFLLAGAALGFAGGFRLGAELSAEFVDRPSVEAVMQEFDQTANLIPGLYWEYAPSNFGIGMTALLDLNKSPAPAPVGEQLWLDWISSLDVRYHFLGSQAFLDPFIEGGFGAAGRSDITDYEALGVGSNDWTPTHLSLFGQVGAGLALKLSIFHLGAKADWRFWNGVVPGTNYDPYPLKNVSVAVFGGLAF
jgi:hypothetical protein